jgi:uncharacterized protein involved in exopolysaccharide biosynthesis
MATGRVPAAGTDYIRRLRDLKYQESLFELLAKQFEIAKIDEAKDATIVQVIYQAVPPEKRIKPKRANLVLIAAFGGFLLATLGAFIAEYWATAANNPEMQLKLEILKRHVRLRSAQ